MKTKIWFLGAVDDDGDRIKGKDGKEPKPVEVELFEIDAKDALARFPNQYVRELPGQPMAEDGDGSEPKPAAKKKPAAKD